MNNSYDRPPLRALRGGGWHGFRFKGILVYDGEKRYLYLHAGVYEINMAPKHNRPMVCIHDSQNFVVQNFCLYKKILKSLHIIIM